MIKVSADVLLDRELNLRCLICGKPLGSEWNKLTQRKMLGIMKRGVELGLFSEPYWAGVGLTPFAGSARRARIWDVLKEKAEI